MVEYGGRLTDSGQIVSPKIIPFSAIKGGWIQDPKDQNNKTWLRLFVPSGDDHPIDEIPLFSNYSPCFHKIGYIQKIVYKQINYLVKSMIKKSVYFYKIGRFFPGQGGRSLVESRSDFRPLFAGVGRSLVKV